mmetsp:Transcript_41226/g.93234  ORF Transcript_41226/g.93234 Transcript_41226/m.93234 type:complete len:335 (-) Transcript_41226:84-1088(-)
MAPPRKKSRKRPKLSPTPGLELSEASFDEALAGAAEDAAAEAQRAADKEGAPGAVGSPVDVDALLGDDLFTLDGLDDEATSTSAAAPAPDSPRTAVRNSTVITTDDALALSKLPQRLVSGAPHPAWLSNRRHRVTASRFANASGMFGSQGQDEVVRAMIDMPEASSGAHQYGVAMEPEAREKYTEKKKAEGMQVEVAELGLCVWPDEPWLAGSPDGLVVENGITGLLEIKCASSQLSVSFTKGDKWRRAEAQMQGCMAICSALFGKPIPWCDYFVYCREPYDSELIRVTRDPGFFGGMLPKLRTFYDETYLAAVTAKSKKASKAAARQHKKTKR